MYFVMQYFLKYLVRNPPAPLRILVLLVAILAYGTTGFLYFELSANPDVTWLDGLWYTVVTMTTVGYGDFFPKTTGGRFLIGWPIMVFGIGLLGYALSLIAAALVTSKTKEMKGMSSFSLKDHIVFFNFPGVSKLTRLIEELFLDPSIGKHVSMVIVDSDLEELPPELVKTGIHFVRGNPVRDETLTRACIDRALHAIVLSKNNRSEGDSLNVTIALAIEGRSHKVNTVVEIVDPASEELLKKAGCDKIVCTSRFGAHFLSQELLHPGVQEMIGDLLSAKDGQQFYFVNISAKNVFGELAAQCKKTGHMAIGAVAAGKITLNPPDTISLNPGDRLITIGSKYRESI
ncbi:MAG: potassium channel family protein [Syntrophorhabdaceae bacterium]